MTTKSIVAKLRDMSFATTLAISVVAALAVSAAGYHLNSATTSNWQATTATALSDARTVAVDNTTENRADILVDGRVVRDLHAPSWYREGDSVSVWVKGSHVSAFEQNLEWLAIGAVGVLAGSVVFMLINLAAWRAEVMAAKERARQARVRLRSYYSEVL